MMTGEPIKRILIPTDFSESTQPALVFAERLAKGYATEIVLLHVFDTAANYTLAGQTDPANEEVRHKLDGIQLSSPQIPVQRFLHVGEAGKVICWLAESLTCDLIVMGTHGRSGLLHLLLGSVAEYVVRHARCPVVTVRRRPENEEPLKEPLVLPLPAPKYM